jgi:hypothetical protein
MSSTDMEKDLHDLLGDIYVATKVGVGANAWIINQQPHSNQSNRGCVDLSILDLLQHGYQLFFE